MQLIVALALATLAVAAPQMGGAPKPGGAGGFPKAGGAGGFPKAGGAGGFPKAGGAGGKMTLGDRCSSRIISLTGPKVSVDSLRAVLEVQACLTCHPSSVVSSPCLNRTKRASADKFLGAKGAGGAGAPDFAAIFGGKFLIQDNIINTFSS
jgi:hypothetical protein